MCSLSHFRPLIFLHTCAVMGQKLSEYPHEKQEVLQLLAAATDAERLASIELREKAEIKEAKTKGSKGKGKGKSRGPKDADQDEE